MTDDPAAKIRQKNSELVSRIYAGALNPSDYNDIFKAWDELYSALGELDEKKQLEDFEWTEEYIGHFEQAGKLFDKMAANAERPLAERIHDMPYTALLCRPDGTLVAQHLQAGVASFAKANQNILDLMYDPQSGKSFKSLCQADKTGFSEREHPRVVIRLCSEKSNEPSIFLAEIVTEASQRDGAVEKFLLLRAITAAWSVHVERALEAAFQLTKAELDLVESLYRGLTIKEISTWKEKSQATLRTQLSSILQKTGAKGQSDLSRIVSGLVQVFQLQGAEFSSVAYFPQLTTPARQRTQTVELSDGTAVEVIESGDLDGTAFYFIQTSSSPVLSPKIVASLAEQGLKIVSPCRSGLGGTTRRPISHTPKHWAKSHLEVIERLGVSPQRLGGHRCGGLYALELTKLIGKDCQTVLLADTGAPLKSASMINQMPASPKRLFLAARYFPPAVRTPYKLVTSDFYSGREAEQRLVSYFYDGSPADQEILHLDDHWKISRDNIDYCLRNPVQTAQDVSVWSRDTSPLLDAVLQNTHVRFFHGECNYVHRADSVERLCIKTKNTSCNIVEGCGQLLIYAEPQLFVEEIRKMCPG